MQEHSLDRRQVGIIPLVGSIIGLIGSIDRFQLVQHRPSETGIALQL